MIGSALTGKGNKVEMREDLYKVWIPGEMICEKVKIEYAFLIAKAVMEKYYADPTMKVTVERMAEDENGILR